MSHEVDGLRAGKYSVLSTGELTAHTFFDRVHGKRMQRYDLTVAHPDPDVGDILVSVLTQDGDVSWSNQRPEELRLFRCFARYPAPDARNQSGDWRVATFKFNIASNPGEPAGELSITDATTTFDFTNKGIAA